MNTPYRWIMVGLLIAACAIVCVLLWQIYPRFAFWVAVFSMFALVWAGVRCAIDTNDDLCHREMGLCGHSRKTTKIRDGNYVTPKGRTYQVFDGLEFPFRSYYLDAFNQDLEYLLHVGMILEDRDRFPDAGRVVDAVLSRFKLFWLNKNHSHDRAALAALPKMEIGALEPLLNGSVENRDTIIDRWQYLGRVILRMEDAFNPEDLVASQARICSLLGEELGSMDPTEFLCGYFQAQEAYVWVEISHKSTMRDDDVDWCCDGPCTAH
ncbi:hypothetical protein GF380_01890 [Candidatus Uhrbacteria bacterium]|nr:hypothetical protein [Candidatus Uhrbacteria bacterium]MBD3283992.1 hypothetical protein [Candidatus Uhrbacteria bacterium]